MDFNSIEEKMKKTISVFEESLSEVRAGRANPNILNKITVDYYGVATPINIAEIGINPNNDGKVIRLAFPELTEERRKDLVKDIRKIAEESKVAIRAIRRDGMDMAKTAQKNNEMTQDDLTAAETKIQKMTDTKIAEIDELLAKKEKEIMTV